MTPAARLATTIDALAEIADARERQAAPADVVISRFFRARRFIGSKDRAHIAGNVYRILRAEARLGWWLEQADLPLTSRSFALADVMLNDHLPLAELHLLCDGTEYAPGKIGDDEHKALRVLNGQSITADAMPELVKLECPAEVADKFREALGDRFAVVMQSLLQPAAMDVRVNTLRADCDTIFREFKTVGYNVSRCKFAPHGLRLAGRPNLNNHSAFKDGLVEVQDEGSQLIALVTDAQPGMRVLDFCAGAGGKTLALAANMNNKGKIVATDTGASRLAKAKLRFRRAGVQNIEVTSIASENDPWFKRHKGEFDRVLVDAPCSGTGTWRRNPEMRWKQQSLGLDELVPLQQSILASAARLVKPGGQLVYATCSLLPDENEAQVTAFLAAHPDFTVVPVPGIWGRVVPNQPCPVNGDFLRLDPAAHETDGFFAAVLTRKAS